MNWKVRLRNPVFWTTLLAALAGFVYTVLGLLEVAPGAIAGCGAAGGQRGGIGADDPGGAGRPHHQGRTRQPPGTGLRYAG